MATSTTRSEAQTSGDGIIREAMRTVGEAGTEVEARLADAAAATEAGVRATNESLRERSDTSLTLLGAFSVGMAAGLLLGGAHRLLVAAALVPAALVGSVLLERMDRPSAGGSGKG